MLIRALVMYNIRIVSYACVYIYIYVYVVILCVCIYIYIYIYMYVLFDLLIVGHRVCMYIFMDVQTYPKRFLPEPVALSMTQ